MLVLSMIRDWLRPSYAFGLLILAMVFAGIVDLSDVLRHLSNREVILVILLIVASSGVKKILNPAFFKSFFHERLTENQFRLRLMVAVSSISAFLNNTPVVAFMIPYVKEWADSKKIGASRFLIPLSYATMLGGTLTIVGTSTNLLLNGLMVSNNVPSFEWYHFLFPGLLIVILGLVYLAIAAPKTLPNNRPVDQLSTYREYLVELLLQDESKLVGKSITVAGLRQLGNIFLVEIIREGRVIAPVSPQETLLRSDKLVFAGSSQAIMQLVSNSRDFAMADQNNEQNAANICLLEVVVPAYSSLVGTQVKKSNFRQRFQAGIIALQRAGKTIQAGIGNTVLSGGDLLLLLTTPEKVDAISQSNDLILLTPRPAIRPNGKNIWRTLATFAILPLLIAGLAGWIDLLLAVIIMLSLLVASAGISVSELRNGIDIELVVILIGALTLGTVMKNVGLGSWLASFLLSLSGNLGAIGVLAVFFICTTLVTAVMSNAAAASVMFPVGVALADHFAFGPMPFMVCIAFAASGDFMTPFGYQTNLMIMGPGKYKFSDYFRIGLPLTLLYAMVLILFIGFYYGMI